jgi:DDE superfamily endonuclease
MDSTVQPLDDLRAFRNSLYRCFERRADALFELADALLTAGTVPSPVHLSLSPVHRRSWGSLYAALSRGRIEEGPLRELLARHASTGDASRAPIYAVDVSVWSRCDAEASPGRGYYYHPSRHSAAQPISSPAGPTSWSQDSPSSAIRGSPPRTRGASGGRRKRRGRGSG